MSHIDTLRVYKELIDKGMKEDQATIHVAGLESASHGIYQWLKEAKDDFASQKMITVLGGLIVLALTGIGGELWYLSKEVSILSRDMQEVRQVLFQKR